MALNKEALTHTMEYDLAARNVNWTALDNLIIEGTFTPTIIGGTSAGTGTYTTQTGTYTKIGNRVFFNIYAVWTAHTGTGDMLVSNLPFTAGSGTYAACAVWVLNMTLTANYFITAYVFTGTKNIVLNMYNGTTRAPVAMDTSAAIMLTGSYTV